MKNMLFCMCEDQESSCPRELKGKHEGQDMVGGGVFHHKKTERQPSPTLESGLDSKHSGKPL